MSFRDNLQHLRGTRDMSQAQLAELIGVSRQSVAKWESEKSYPEMDKLITLCDLFECSLDDLVRGDVSANELDAEEAELVAAVEAEAPACTAAGMMIGEPASQEAESDDEAVDACGYDEHMRRRAWDIAAGFAVIVLSFGVNFFIVNGYGSMTAGVSIAIHLVGFALSLCFFVPAYRSHAAFRKQHPVVEDFYTSEQKVEARRRKLLGVGGCIALVVLGFYTPGMLATFQIFNQFPSLMLFSCFAAAVFLLVHSTLMDRRADVSFYNGASSFTVQSLIRGRRADS